MSSSPMPEWPWRADMTFAAWADALVEEAQAAKLSDLPALERGWWEADRTKPWAELPGGCEESSNSPMRGDV